MENGILRSPKCPNIRFIPYKDLYVGEIFRAQKRFLVKSNQHYAVVCSPKGWPRHPRVTVLMPPNTLVAVIDDEKA